MPFFGGLMLANASGGGGIPTVTATVSTNQTNLNVFTFFGSPAGVANYILTINAGVTVSSSSTGTAACITGTFATGSTLTIVNKGTVVGKEGAGGSGGSAGNICTRGAGDGGPGTAAGNAMSLGMNLSIDNTTTGQVFGGGGGGGGSGGGFRDQGGCAGVSGVAGNAGGTGAGTSAATGGVGGSGNGGTWGAAGAAGSSGATLAGCPPYSGGAGGSGGAAGKAVALNSNTITWIAGNNAAQVKGNVS